MSYTISREMAQEIREIIEDSVEFFCDENMVSGELAWIMVETLAQAKLAEMKGQMWHPPRRAKAGKDTHTYKEMEFYKEYQEYLEDFEYGTTFEGEYVIPFTYEDWVTNCKDWGKGLPRRLKHVMIVK